MIFAESRFKPRCRDCRRLTGKAREIIAKRGRLRRHQNNPGHAGRTIVVGLKRRPPEILRIVMMTKEDRRPRQAQIDRISQTEGKLHLVAVGQDGLAAEIKRREIRKPGIAQRLAVMWRPLKRQRHRWPASMPCRRKG